MSKNTIESISAIDLQHVCGGGATDEGIRDVRRRQLEADKQVCVPMFGEQACNLAGALKGFNDRSFAPAVQGSPR